MYFRSIKPTVTKPKPHYIRVKHILLWPIYTN